MESRHQNVVDIMISSRSDAMHLAPVVHAMRQFPLWESRIFVLQDEEEDLDSTLITLGLTPTVSWRLRGIRAQPTLFLGELLIFLNDLWCQRSPDWILIYGHSSFAFSCSFAASEKDIRIANFIDADHRSFSDRTECQMRNTISSMSSLHFIANAHIRNSLIQGGVDDRRIYVVGSTIGETVETIRRNWPSANERPNLSGALPEFSKDEWEPKDFIFCSLTEPEAREFFSTSFCSEISRRIPDTLIVFEARKCELSFTAENVQTNVVQIERASHLQLCRLLENALCVLSDSAELLDECTSYGTPGILLQANTDRIDLICSGRVTMAERFPQNLLKQISSLARAPKKKIKEERVFLESRAESVHSSARIAQAITSQTNETGQKEKTSLLHPQAR
jgi:UDP-N-acetylglucosamine 2-epimerase (non-hydrolysing)